MSDSNLTEEQWNETQEAENFLGNSEERNLWRYRNLLAGLGDISEWEKDIELLPRDYYNRDEYQDYGSNLAHARIGDDDYGSGTGTGNIAIARNAVEHLNTFRVERNLQNYFQTNGLPTKEYYYDEDEVQLSSWSCKPHTYLLIGKPGIGKRMLAKKMANALNCVYITPETVIEYYKGKDSLPSVNFIHELDAGKSINIDTVASLIFLRMNEMDVLHRGYVMPCFPFFTSDPEKVSTHLSSLNKHPLRPEFIILFRMQDIDFFKRRTEQKLDPKTGLLYTRDHYSESGGPMFLDPEKWASTQGNPSEVKTSKSANTSMKNPFDKIKLAFFPFNNIQNYERGSTMKAYRDHVKPIRGNTVDPKDFDKKQDFSLLPRDVRGRLITRFEDKASNVHDDMEAFHKNLATIQQFIDSMDSRKVLQLNSYWSPNILFKNVWDFLQASGSLPCPIPHQLYFPLPPPSESEMGEEDCEGIEQLEKILWENEYFEIARRSNIDPRFKWRLSRWKNLCPVQLKYGRSIEGKPQHATIFQNKMYFLSSLDAVTQFNFNPRFFLLPPMPMSPVRFYVIGQPITGKSILSKALATAFKGFYINMEEELCSRLDLVKKDFLYRKRLQYTLEARILVDKENHELWKRLERGRRQDLHDWIAVRLASRATEEIGMALNDILADEKYRRNIYRDESWFHRLKEPYGSSCEIDYRYTWRNFVDDCKSGKDDWSHQELLELAYALFNERRLFYKKHPQDLQVPLTDFQSILGEYDDDDSFLMPEIEELGETDTEDEQKLAKSTVDVVSKKEKKKKKCVKAKPPALKTGLMVYEVEPKSDSSELDPEPEFDESFRMRFPDMPEELSQAIPQFLPVKEDHPVVEQIVNDKMKVENNHVDQMPPEIYVEVLRRACLEVQTKYLEQNINGPLSGGWVVDNVIYDLDTWRVIVATEDVCPDQVLVVTDNSLGHIEIFNSLNEILKAEKRYASVMSSFTRDTAYSRDRESNSVSSRVTDEGAIDYSQEESLKLNKDGLTNVGSSLQSPKPSESELKLIKMDRHRDRSVVDHCRDSSGTKKASRKRQKAFSGDNEESRGNEETEKECSSIDLEDSYIQNILGLNKAEEQEKQVRKMSFEMYSWIKSEETLEKERNLKKQEMTKTEPELQSLEAFMPEMMSLPEDSIEDPTEEADVPDEGSLEDPSEDTSDEKQSDQYDYPFTYEETGEIEESYYEMIEDDDFNSPYLRSHSKSEIVDELICSKMKAKVAPSYFDFNTPEKPTYELKRECLEKFKAQSPVEYTKMKIKEFNRFWKNTSFFFKQQNITFFKIDTVKQSEIDDCILSIWNRFESRFQYQARPMTLDEMKEHDADIYNSVVMWSTNDEELPKFSAGVTLYKPRHGKFRNDSSSSSFDEEDESTGEVEEEDSSSRKSGKDAYINLDNLQDQPDLFNERIRAIEDLRLYGDTKYWCPVALQEKNLLRVGFPDRAAMFKDRIYMLSDDNSLVKFLENPMNFVSSDTPLKAPPPRICITGSPGCGQQEAALDLCRKHNTVYINFRQRMHELMRSRLGKYVGPDKTGTIRRPTRGTTADTISLDEYDDEETEDEERESGNKNQAKKLLKIPESKFGNLAPYLSTIPKSCQVFCDDMMFSNAALESLGLLDTSEVAGYPIAGISRTEKMSTRDWSKLDEFEEDIKNFLEHGQQLSEEVLDHYIAPLWKEEPYSCLGFILVGFPNTIADVEYLVQRDLIPEAVYVCQSNVSTVRNRFIVEAVKNWHTERSNYETMEKNNRMPTDMFKNSKASISQSTFSFQYQTEGRSDTLSHEKELSKLRYNDEISAEITKALKYYHFMYSKDLGLMKQYFNINKIWWYGINADHSALQAQEELINLITPTLKNRSNVLEQTIQLKPEQADRLLNFGYFQQPSIMKWCPVEISNGNIAINLWNAPNVKKIPVLYGQYIFQIAGEKNYKQFRENAYNLVRNIEVPLMPIPFVLIIRGYPSTGRTTLARKLESRLGLLYASGECIIDHVMDHTFINRWNKSLESPTDRFSVGPQGMTLAEELLAYVRSGVTVPKQLFRRALDIFMLQPKAQYHGIVLDDYPVLAEDLQHLLLRGCIPSAAFYLESKLVAILERIQIRRSRFYDFDSKNLPDLAEALVEEVHERDLRMSLVAQGWLKDEVQGLTKLDATQSEEKLYRMASDKVKWTAMKLQRYLISMLSGHASTLEGTCPLTSQIPARLSPQFQDFCPVALRESDELLRADNLLDLKQLVEYQGFVYWISNIQRVFKFLRCPKKYLSAEGRSIPNEDLPKPCCVPHEDSEADHEWGFLDLDVVYYVESGFDAKNLKQGCAEFCTEYKGKIYQFRTEANLKLFKIKPQKYCNIPLPKELPKKSVVVDLDKVSMYTYLTIKGVIPVLKELIKVMAEKRPRVPRMTSAKAAALFMGYFFKSKNMQADYAIRHKYRNAMFDMQRQQAWAKEFTTELKGYYGARLNQLPEKIKTEMKEFIKYLESPEEEKVLFPTIKGQRLGYKDAAEPCLSDKNAFSRNVKEMIALIEEIKRQDKMNRSIKICQERQEKARAELENARYAFDTL